MAASAGATFAEARPEPAVIFRDGEVHGLPAIVRSPFSLRPERCAAREEDGGGKGGVAS